MVKKLAIHSLRRGIGSMDYIDTLLIMEDDLDEDDQDAERLGESSHDNPLNSGTDPCQSQSPSQSQNPNPTPEPTPESVPDWCTCGKCRPMPQQVENKCCKQKKCITLTSRFAKLCLVQMCWSFVSAIGVISVMIERTTAQKHFAKLLIDSLFWHAMAIWAKRINEFVHPVWF